MTNHNNCETGFGLCCRIATQYVKIGNDGYQLIIYNVVVAFLFLLAFLYLIYRLHDTYRQSISVGSPILPLYYSYLQAASIWFLLQLIALIVSKQPIFLIIDAFLYAAHGYMDNALIVYAFFQKPDPHAAKSTFLICTVLFLIRGAYMVVEVIKNPLCGWCPLFQPAPNVMYLDMLWVAGYAGILICRFLPLDIPKPRATVYPWVLFLLIVYTAACFGTSFIQEHIDFGYCAADLAVTLYASFYAPLIYFTFCRDTKVLLVQFGGKELDETSSETKPLIPKRKSKSNLNLIQTLQHQEIKVIPLQKVVVQQKIGTGGFGEVYKGTLDGKDVAVKRLFGKSDEFVKEAQTLHQLSHPNIVTLVGVCLENSYYIITEYLPNGSVFAMIHRPNARLGWKLVHSFAMDCARGMHYLHSQNPVIIHRDLKTHNLLVGKNYNVKLCDFGFARAKVSDLMSTVGTVQWTAPEVLREEKYTEKADLFSYGVIIWELVTKQEPFVGRTPVAIATSVAFHGETLPIPSGCPPSLADIMNACWRPTPEDRPTFEEIITLLEKLNAAILMETSSMDL